MAPKKDTEDGITWNNENIINFCEVVSNYIMKNGRGQQINWREIEDLFAEKVGKRVGFKSSKNKYDAMKKDWRLWKFLKFEETGLGWNSTTGRLDCSDEWWQRKLQEKPEARKFRHKGVCPQVEEKWESLFGGSVATGDSVVAPSINPESVYTPVIDVDGVQNGDGLSDEVYIRPRDASFQGIPPHIEHDSRYMPYFKDCIGCIDGTHINACIPLAEQTRYRGRKGVPTFNVMAVCDFDMCFTFISVEWEGSAHDTKVFNHAVDTPSMNFPKPPEGKYYIVDKGYPDRKGFIAPYPRIRYHQSQFEHVLPTNAQEAFNRVYSSLRSCIERSFGVLKKRWRILNNMPRFDEETQIDVIMATFALYNYIRRNDSTGMIFNVVNQHANYIPTEEVPDNSTAGPENIRESRHAMREIRDNIANMIWSTRNF